MSKVFFHFLYWCGQHSALLVAIMGFASSVAIAKISSGLDLRRTLYLRRFEAYEKAIGHLSRKMNVYENIMAAFYTLKDPNFDFESLRVKVVVLLSYFDQLGKIEMEDRELSGIVLYSKLPRHDVKPVMREIAQFYTLLQDYSNLINHPTSRERLEQFVPNFINGVSRLEPLITKEIAHLNAMYEQLYDDICKDKTVKKMLHLK